MNNKFCGVILKTSYDRMGETAGIDILGKSMLDWVKLALSDTPVAIADYDASVELPLLLRPYIVPGCEYMVVLFSDTPLVTRKTVASVIEEATRSARSVLKMTRGYVFRCSFLATADKIYTNDTVYFDEEDFITAFNFKQVGLITDILKNRILDYHMEQGVRFTDLTGTVIGCDVSIESGAVIGYGNILLGKTRISSGASLGNGNRLTDCIVKSGAVVNDTVANRAIIGANAKVGPFTVLNGNVVIGDGATVGSFVELSNIEIEGGAEIFSSSVAMKKIVKADEQKQDEPSEQTQPQPEIVDKPETASPQPETADEVAQDTVENISENIEEVAIPEQAVEQPDEEVVETPEEVVETPEEVVETPEEIEEESDEIVVDTELYEGEVEQVNPDEIAPKYDYYDEIDAEDAE